MKKSETRIEGNRTEKWINWAISILMLLLALETCRVLDERWDSLNHLPVYIYAGVLFFYLVIEKIAYRGSEIKGKQSKKWTRYSLLFFWSCLLTFPLLEYSLYPRYNLTLQSQEQL